MGGPTREPCGAPPPLRPPGAFPLSRLQGEHLVMQEWEVKSQLEGRLMEGGGVYRILTNGFSIKIFWRKEQKRKEEEY